MSIEGLLIDGLPFLSIVVLCAGTLLVSFLVAAIGPSGGLQLVTVAATVPAAVVIPIHAWITGFSGLFRALSLRGHIDRGYVGRFVPASVLGATAVAAIMSRLDLGVLQVVIATYILVTASLDLAGHRITLALPRRSPVLAGFCTGLLSMVIGATGPLLITLMQPHFETKEELSATFSACLTFQHLSKIVLFGLIGASVLRYPTVLAVTLICAAAGTLLGRHVLLALSERTYRVALSVMLIVVSATLLISLAAG